MRLNKAIIIGTLLTAISAVPALADDFDDHSVYRVTSYNFGSLDGSSEGSLSSTLNSLPLLITGYQADVLDDMNLDDSRLSASAKNSGAGGFALSARYAPNNSFALHGSFGMTKSDWDAGSEETNSSWEANLGIIYKLFNNVSYGVHFGYMDTGDVYKRRSTYNDVESVIMVSNQLTLSF